LRRGPGCRRRGLRCHVRGGIRLKSAGIPTRESWQPHWPPQNSFTGRTVICQGGGSVGQIARLARGGRCSGRIGFPRRLQELMTCELRVDKTGGIQGTLPRLPRRLARRFFWSPSSSVMKPTRTDFQATWSIGVSSVPHLPQEFQRR
jgi:hypothetical protein